MPLSAPIAPGGAFDAKARSEKYDEDYEFVGKLNHDLPAGTFTRKAHYVGAGTSGPRCTATWTVKFKEEPWVAFAPPK